jgi:hypothetical protein
MNIKRKACDIRTWKETFISRHTLHQHCCACPIALPVRRIPELFHPVHICFCRILYRVTWAGIICDFRTSLREFIDTVVDRFMRQTLRAVNRKHFFVNILCIESFCAQESHNRTLLCGSILLKHGCHFDYWNQLLNMRIRVCYLDCHEGGLCFYLVMYIENHLHPLQLFYFHLWPIYWSSLVRKTSVFFFLLLQRITSSLFPFLKTKIYAQCWVRVKRTLLWFELLEIKPVNEFYL